LIGELEQNLRGRISSDAQIATGFDVIGSGTVACLSPSGIGMGSRCADNKD
jgi:hypothetical protein